MNIGSRIWSYVGKEMSGKEFNELFPDIEFVKLTNIMEKHHGFQYMDGLNINIHKFDHDNGGLHFTPKIYAHMWIICEDKVMVYTRKVTLPDDAKIYIKNTTCIMSDKLILDKEEEIHINEYIKYLKNNELPYRFRYFKYIFKYLKIRNIQQAKIFCLEYMKCTGVKICEPWVDELPECILTKEMCVEALKYNPSVIKHIPQRFLDKDMCISAIKQQPTVLKYVPETFLDNNFCMEIIENNCYSYMYIPDKFKTIDISKLVVKKDRNLLNYVPNNLKQYI